MPAPSISPVIQVTGGALYQTVSAAEAALIAAGDSYFQRGNMIVRPGWSYIHTSEGSKVPTLSIVTATEAGIAEAMTRAASFLTFDKRSEKWHPADCPPRVAETYMARVGLWKLPVLTGLIQAPTLRPDGSILDLPGYDAGTCLLFDPLGVNFPMVPQNPSRDEALIALGTLKALIKDFPFVADADRAVALSGILTGLVRRSLPTAPLHAFTAPIAGSGKSMLVDLSAILATGQPASVISQGGKEEEFEKRLGGCLLAGDPVIAIDNCEAPLGGETLCQCLTQRIVRIRILGKSKNPALVSNAAMYATGNNLVLYGDMIRRSLLCSLDPARERQELREFDADPIKLATKDRAALVVAGLTALRAFVVAGKPAPGMSRFGSFEEWSGLVRGALVWLGEADPLVTAEAVRGSDPQLDQLRQVVEAWRAVIGGERVSVRGLIESATAVAPPGTATGGTQVDSVKALREALLVVAGNNGVVNSMRLGRWLGRNKNRMVGSATIRPEGTVDGIAQYRLIT